MRFTRRPIGLTLMNVSFFFRLLRTPIEAKGRALAEAVAALNAGATAPETFALDPAELRRIPGTPFAYWAGDGIRQLFGRLPSVEGSGFSVQHGASTKNDLRFLRLWWEVPLDMVGKGRRWVPFAKGGEYSPYYGDVYLLIHWENDAEEIHRYLVDRYPYLEGKTGWILHPENTYFRPGLTWSFRSQKGFNLRALPGGCVFAHVGPSVFVPGDGVDTLLALLAVTNSLMFQMLLRLQLGFGAYEVGLIRRTPIPPLTPASCLLLSCLAREAYDLQRERDRGDETTHAFCLPLLVKERGAPTLRAAAARLEAQEQARAKRLAAIQAQIDDLVFDLYGLSAGDRALVRREMAEPSCAPTIEAEEGARFADEPPTVADEETEGEAPAPARDLLAHVQDLLQWCVGVAFGRWDVRKALDPALLPPLGGPFDPLPPCAPGALTGPDGLPPAEPPPGYPLPLAWDGILVDDPTHPADTVARVRAVLALLWGERAAAVEREACAILGRQDLRDYFRDARQGFFAWHIKRYSKSRRKAPIYWLLQSERRAYALWLYAHRLTPTTLFVAGRDYADVKVALEEGHLEELRQGAQSLGGSARRQREREIERQEKVVAEIRAFRDRLDRVALLNLVPDLNDGILISIAPLWELVPWKEAHRMWEELRAGKHAWSAMDRQMRERGLVLS